MVRLVPDERQAIVTQITTGYGPRMQTSVSERKLNLKDDHHAGGLHHVAKLHSHQISIQESTFRMWWRADPCDRQMCSKPDF